MSNRKERRATVATKRREPATDEDFTKILQVQVQKALRDAAQKAQRQPNAQSASCVINALLITASDVAVQTGCPWSVFADAAEKFYETLAHGYNRKDLLQPVVEELPEPTIILTDR